jgi:hypothetical protein
LMSISTPEVRIFQEYQMVNAPEPFVKYNR